MVLTAVTGLILIPVQVEHLGVDLIGAWSAIGSVIAWISVLDPGISSVIQQKSASANALNQTALSAEIKWVSKVTALILGSVVLIAGLLSTYWVFHLNERLLSAKSNELNYAYILSLVGLAFTIAGFNANAILQGSARYRESGYANIISLLGGAATTYALLHAEIGVVSIAAGTLVRGVVFYSISWGFLGRDEGPPASRDPALLILIAKQTAFTFVGRSVAVASSNLDSILIATVVSPAVAGLYFIAKRAFDVVRMILERIIASLAPQFSSMSTLLDERQVKQIALRSLILYIIVSGIALLPIVKYGNQLLVIWIGHDISVPTGIWVSLGIWNLSSTYFAVVMVACNALGNFRSASYAAMTQGVLALGATSVLIRYESLENYLIINASLTLATTLVLQLQTFREKKVTWTPTRINYTVACAILILGFCVIYATR